MGTVNTVLFRDGWWQLLAFGIYWGTFLVCGGLAWPVLLAWLVALALALRAGDRK